MKLKIVLFAGVILLLVSGVFMWLMPHGDAGPKKRSGALREFISATPAANIEVVTRDNSAASPAKGVLELPFLGPVGTKVENETTTVNIPGENSRVMKFRVYNDERGRFLRATFLQEGKCSLEDSAHAVQEGMEVRDEMVTGLVKHPPIIPWTKLLSDLGKDVPMERVTELSITYLEYKLLGGSPAPMYLIHVFGAITPSPNIPNIEANRRIRFIANQQGKIVSVDNCL